MFVCHQIVYSLKKRFVFSNGVSRTGPFLTLFTAIQDINEGRVFSDLNKIIRLLRSKRRHMIQDMNQLKFVYEAFLYYVQDLLVKRNFIFFSFLLISSSFRWCIESGVNQQHSTA